MHEKYMNLLCCPETGEELNLTVEEGKPNGMVVSGKLVSRSGRIYPIVRGIPRFVKSEHYAASFGFEWNHFGNKLVTLKEDREFLTLIPPIAPEFFKDKVILDAGCGMVNAIPVFISSSEYWAPRFRARGVPIIGDDIKSQVGATITHRMLAHLFVERGVRIDRTYQLNFGGNTDFMNMLERERLESKKISKTNSVTSQIPYPMDPDNVHVGPSDYVPWLQDRKFCYIRMEGTTFGDVPLNLELKLEVWDSPNSAGVVIDAVRCVKIALDRGMKGALVAPSSYLMKSPPKQYPDDKARQMVEEFIAK